MYLRDLQEEDFEIAIKVPSYNPILLCSPFTFGLPCNKCFVKFSLWLAR